MTHSTRTVLAAAALYGVVAFAIGFVFGALRQLVLIPWLGERAGHWAEFPLVTASIMAFGIWLSRRRGLGETTALLTGFGGVIALLAIESVFALGLMGMSVEAFLSTFNILEGALFPYGLVLMGLAPWVAARLSR